MYKIFHFFILFSLLSQSIAHNETEFKGTRLLQLWLESFRYDHWTSDISLFDLVILKPPSSSTRPSSAQKFSTTRLMGMDGKDIDVSCNFCKLVVHLRGYEVIIMHFFTYEKWFQSFRNCGIELMQHPNVIMYDYDTVRTRSPPKFPQQMTEFALIGKAQLTAHATFKTSFEADFNTLRYPLTRKRSAVFNVLSVKSN